MTTYTEVGPHGSKDLNNTGPQVPMTQQIVRKGGLVQRVLDWAQRMPCAEATVTPEAPNTLPSTRHIQILRTQSFWTASSSRDASRLEMGRALAS